jgi:hypothetical protein
MLITLVFWLCLSLLVIRDFIIRRRLECREKNVFLFYIFLYTFFKYRVVPRFLSFYYQKKSLKEGVSIVALSPKKKKKIFTKIFAGKTPLGVILCEKSIARIPKARKRF